MKKAAGFYVGALGALGTMLLSSAPSWAQPVTVVYQKGLLTIQCTNAPLSSVFESIASQTGIELILEDETKSKRLTASLNDVPVAMAIQRLLEGTGVNYIVMMDPSDWGRVGKVFVGGGGSGAGSARTARGPRRSMPAPGPVETAEQPPEETFEEAADAIDPGDPGLDPGSEAENAGLQSAQESPADLGEAGEFANPPGSSPVPDFLPPAQSFPRSNFTPGLPGKTQRTPQGGAAQPQEQNPANPANPPPATFPFTDPFGRPIPVPPGMTTPQQPQQKKQQKQ